MTTPKPVPSKPLTFTPPQFLKGETKPTVEVITKDKPKSNKIKGHRADIAIVDEIFHSDGGVTLKLGVVEDPKTVEKPKKPFVLDPHLTQRPFHDDRLMQLKNRLQRPSFKNR